MMSPPTLTQSPSPTAELCGGISNGNRNAQDRKDLERFAKFFTVKCVQVIVQSRLGEKIKSCSKPLSTGADWFNLTIDDNPEILTETKRAISSTPLPGSPPLYIEISLKTPEDTLILEIWSLSFKPELQEPNIRILYTVYNRMALLLKSLISVTRVIPAYKLSRMKTSDYIMCYNIYTEEQKCNLGDVLGHDYKHVELGTVGTPFGGLLLELHYRTRLEIIVPGNKTMMIKSDHYGNGGAKEIQTQAQSDSPSSETSWLQKNDVRDKFSQPDANKLPNTPKNGARGGGSPQIGGARPSPVNVIGAFEPISSVPVIDDDDDSSIPFSNLLKQSMKFKKIQNLKENNSPSNVSNTNNDPILEVPDVKVDSQTSVSSSSSSGGGTGDRNAADFIMVDLKTPFAPGLATTTAGTGTSSSGNDADPLVFFNQVKEAPISLSSLESNLPALSVDFEGELNSFQESLQEYDDFVKQLCGNNDLEGGGSSSSGSSGQRFP